MSEFILMSNHPVNINGFNVYPVKLEEILIITEEQYNQYLGLINLTRKELTKYTNDIELKKKSVYELIILWCIKDEAFKEVMIDCLSFFLREEIHVDENGIGIIREGQILYMTREIYDLIIYTIKKQNFIQTSEIKEYKPANGKAQELLERMKKAKEKLRKEKNEENLTLSDIMSIVSCYSNDINILTVWNLTVYQLYTVYLRLLIWDDYQTKQNMLPHVTDVKALDMKHWAMSINNKLKEK